MSKPPTVAELAWTGDLTFAATINDITFTLDSAGVRGPSPVGALASALAGCMSMDIAHILTRGRHPFTGLAVRLVGERQQDDPHCFSHITLHVAVQGAVPADAVERAIALSREKYCSVWHSMRQDIVLTTSFEIR